MAAVNGATAQSRPVQQDLRVKRMTMESVVTGKVAAPLRLLIHGVDGVGKSTFGASAPKPIFLGTEDGSEHLDVARFPTPECWQDLLDAVQTLTTGTHDRETLVLDSLDWAEPFVWQYVCQKAGEPNIEAIGGGFGKGYTAALDEWRVLIRALERMQRERKLNLVLLAHSFIKKFANPQGEDFDRYILKLNEKAAGLLREWCKGVYFANYETFAVKDKAKRVRGISTGARLLYTQRTAAFDAKDHYGLPEQLALSWEEFEKLRQSGEGSIANLKTEIERKAKQLGGDIEKVVMKTMNEAGDDANRLAQINNRVNARLGEKEQA